MAEEKKEFEFDENEMEELKKTIEVLQNEKEELLESKLPANTDKYAIDFIKLLDEHDFSYRTTHEVFDDFLEYRRKFTNNGEEILSLRMFNSVMRRFFPKAKIGHSNKGGKNTYFWVIETDE